MYNFSNIVPVSSAYDIFFLYIETVSKLGSESSDHLPYSSHLNLSGWQSITPLSDADSSTSHLEFVF